jgi:hypothetical protein
MWVLTYVGVDVPNTLEPNAPSFSTFYPRKQRSPLEGELVKGDL